ncbi:hypothetical protein KC336_g21281 [Hortaea werneckii]|nr:hypothetical protein KC336_g21281 [Hortaea werneckii]
MFPFRGGPNSLGSMNGVLGGGGRKNGKTGPDSPGSMNSTNGLPGISGINSIPGPPGMNSMNSMPGLPGIARPQPGPPVPNSSTGISLPSNWRDFPIDKTTGKIDRRAVGGAAGQNGIEKDGDLLIIESMGIPGRPFNPFQRDLQTFWANPLLRPRARKLFWKPFDESVRREREMWEAVMRDRRGWPRRRWR